MKLKEWGFMTEEGYGRGLSELTDKVNDWGFSF